MMPMNRGILISTLFLLIFTALPSRAEAEEPSQFGVGVAPQEFKESLKGIEKLGIGIVRIPLQWQLVQPRQDEFDWNITDRIVEAARAKHSEILFTLRSISSWGTRQQTRGRGIYHSSSAPSDMEKWERFVTGLASRYRGLGVYYEIENEVNAPAFWDGTTDEYLELLKASYKAIKVADPRARILSSAVGCGITHNFQQNVTDTCITKRHDEWLKAILLTKAFDLVSVHDYYFPSEIVANGFTFRSYLEHIRNLMQEAGVGDHKIWITETGYVSRPTDASGRMDYGSPEKQARWLSEAYHQAFALGVDRVFWLLLRDRTEPYFGSMGLVDSRGKPRPACKTLRELTQGNLGMKHERGPLTIEQVKERYEDDLMGIKGVVGVAIGRCEGNPCIKVYLENDSSTARKQIPAQLNGFKVDTEVTGPFKALQKTGTSQ